MTSCHTSFQIVMIKILLSVDAVDRLVPREFLSVPVRAGAPEAGRRRQLHLLHRLEEAVGERRRHGVRQRPVRDG